METMDVAMSSLPGNL